MIRSSVVIILSAIAMTTAVAQDVRRVAVGETADFGITYTLPRTVLRFTVTATRTDIEAGVYAAYAEKLLGIKDAPQADATVWTIGDVSISAVAEADTSRSYHITFGEKGALPTFYLTPDGSLWSINMMPDGLAAAPSAVVTAATAAPAQPSPTVAIYNEDLLKAGSKARAAELAARHVFRIRESRMDLLTGDVDNLPHDGASYQLVLDNLQAQEDAYMQLFTGRSTSATETRTFTIVPTEAIAGDVLFRFSRHFGFVDADDLSGEPYVVSLSVVEDNRARPLAAIDKKGRRPEQGIAYAVDGRAVVRLSHDDTTLASADVRLGQLGRVEQLPVGLFTDKKRVVRAQFNPLTGAITIYEQQ